MGPDGWNVMEQLTGHPGGDFGTVESVSEREVSQILSPERPKRANMVQRWPKSDLEHSGGPKQLDWHSISYRTSWLRFCTVGSVSVWGVSLILAHEHPKKAKMA